MIRVVVLLLLILGVWIALRYFKMPVAQRSKWRKQMLLGGGILLLAILAATGRMSWLLTVVGVGLAFIARSLPILIRYAPQLQRLWIWFNQSSSQAAGGSNSSSVASAHMTKEQAWAVLGLEAGASEEDIIQAHRKLISRLHPDRGGSDFLAAQINQAKKVLLRH